LVPLVCTSEGSSTNTILIPPLCCRLCSRFSTRRRIDRTFIIYPPCPLWCKFCQAASRSAACCKSCGSLLPSNSTLPALSMSSINLIISDSCTPPTFSIFSRRSILDFRLGTRKIPHPLDRPFNYRQLSAQALQYASQGRQHHLFVDGILLTNCLRTLL
jgi:hypothetical protein